MSNAAENEKAPRGIGRFFRSEGLIGSLVALLSILTALIGYRATVVDNISNDHALNAQRTLSEANREYLDAGQKVMQDFISYDNYYAVSNNEATDNYYSSFSAALIENVEDPDREIVFDDLYYESLQALDTGLLNIGDLLLLDIISYDNYYASTNLSAADNYYASFSDALVQNLDDPDRLLFDDVYNEQMYGFSGTCFAEADTLFIQSQDVGNVADQYQLVMFIFAIGLAMAAWASLLNETGNMRIAFVIFALAALVYGSMLYLGIGAEAAETLSRPINLTCLEALTGQ